MITHNFDLDMTPGETPVEIQLNKNDADFSIVFALFSSLGTLTIESGTTAQIRGRKPGGGSYTANASIDIEAKTVTVTGDSAMTAEAGAGLYEICLTHGGKELYSANFHIVVEQITQ